MPRGARLLVGSLVLLASLGAARGARAQGTITDPPATFTRPVSAFDSSPVASFTGISADPMADHVFEMGWWYRLAGATAEKPLPAPSGQIYAANTSTVTWNAVEGAFQAVETNVVTNGGGPSGQVLFSLVVTNLSVTAPLGIDVFHMADLDLGGTTEGDQATLVTPNELMRVTDGADTAEYGARGAAAYLVRAYDDVGVTDVAGHLSDAILDDFDDTGLPFGPGDFSGGFQWTTTMIPPGESATFVAGIAVNMALALPPGATTTSTIATETTTTTLAAERCDDCVDDDGDGLVDFEDPDCCVPAPLTLRRGALRPRAPGTATLKLTARLATSPVADGAAATQDVTVQLRAGDAVFCARIPAASLVRRRKGLSFRDDGAAPASAHGIDRVLLVEKRRGAKLVVEGAAAELDAPAPGTLTATLGLRDAAASRCAAGSATFRAAKKGVRFP